MLRLRNFVIRSANRLMARATMSSTPGHDFGMGSPQDQPITSLDRLLRFKPALDTKGNKTWYSDTSQQENYEDDEDMDWGEYAGELEEGEEIDEQDPLLKVGKKLLQLGRVPYHHIEDMPQWFEDHLAQVCAHRTSPQIRRCMQDWMLKSDREVYTAYRSKRLYWRETDKREEKNSPIHIRAYGPDETVGYAHYFAPSYFGISRRVFRELHSIMPAFKPKNMLDFGCGPGTAGAAAVDVWGEDELDEYTERWNEKKYVKSAHAWRRESRDKYKSAAQAPKKALSDMRYTGVDVSQAMLDAANVVLKGTLPNTTLWDKIGDVVKRAHTTGERFDLINVSYTLSELHSDPMRRAAVLLLFELLDVGGALVIVENGSPVGSHTVRTARQLVLDTFGTRTVTGEHSRDVMKKQPEALFSKGNRKNKNKDEDMTEMDRDRERETESGPMDPNPKLTVAQQTTRMLRAPMGLEHSQIAAAVVAPCTHDGQCPLRKGFWCSFSQNVHSGKIKKGNEEKFSYVVLRKIAVGHAALSFTKDIEGVWTNLSARSPMENSPSPLSVLREAGNIPRKDVAAFLHNVDWETYAPPLHRDEWGRILRSPIKKKAHIIMDVCQPDATVSRSTLTRSSVPKVPALYTALRKINWGGLYPALGNSEGGLSSRISSFSKMQEHDQFIPVDKDMMDTNQLVSSRGTSGGRKGGRNSNSNKTNAPASEMAFVANDKASRSVIKQDMGSMNSRIAMKAAAKLFGSINMNDDHGKKQSIGSNDDSAAAAVVSGGGRRRARAIQGQALSAHARRLGRTKRSRSAADDGEEAAEGK